jgi:hypothetical protein
MHKNTIRLTGDGNIVIQDVANGNITINQNDQNLFEKLKKLQNEEIAVLQQMISEQTEKFTNLFNTMVNRLVSQKNIVNNYIQAESSNVGDEIHYHYHYNENIKHIRQSITDNPDFFRNQNEKEIRNLGLRFNAKLNFELPIAQLFDVLSHNEIFHQRLFKIIDNWLTEKSYHKHNVNEYLSELEQELETLKKELKNLVNHWVLTIKEQIELNVFIDRLLQFNKKISDKKNELYRIEDWKTKTNKFENEFGRIREIENNNYAFLKDIEGLKINLANNPTLVIQGEAGCGKSHLLGDIASQRKNQALPTILLLGTTFNNTITIEQNILYRLDLSYSFNEFLTELNNIGLFIKSRVLILIDAINEGAGVDLWKNQIAGFINEIAKYPAIGLVLTIRSTYFDDIIPKDLKTNPQVNIVTHIGFKGNEYEALRLFSGFYNLTLPNFPILNPEFSNPLFLHLICEYSKNLPEKSFPKGFNGITNIYDSYKETLNSKFGEKRHEYKNRRIVTKAIEIFANALFNTKYGQLELNDAVDLFDNKLPLFPHLLTDLIEESVFIKMRPEHGESRRDFISFSYQKLGDFFMAVELLSAYSTKGELIEAFEKDEKFHRFTDNYQWQCNGIIEIFAILLPEKFDLELFELIELFYQKNEVDKWDIEWERHHIFEAFSRLLLDSLKWRELSSINENKITAWLIENGRIENNEWINTLTELSATPNHPFNSDRLHGILMKQTMAIRDSFWQKYLMYYNGNDESEIAFPIRRLIDWAWIPNISSNMEIETTRLVAQTLTWVLASTDIALRDQTTKALVNLLEQQPEILITTLRLFEKVDDLYISERLYAVAYGCILRTKDKKSVKKIAKFVYDTVFKENNPPTHILLRDYARSSVEYAIYKNVELDLHLDLIHPPHNSRMPILPQGEDDVKEFKLDYNSPDFKETHGFEQNAIYSSIISGIADFGHYVVESTVSHFDEHSFRADEKQVIKSWLVRYWLVKRVFELGYDRKLHGEYDNFIHNYYSYNRHAKKIERIGKKYQWIAYYEILANLADNYKMKEIWSINNKYENYKGAWQLYLRNIDPAYTTKNIEVTENDVVIAINEKKWWADKEYAIWDYPDSDWVKTIDDLPNLYEIIEKKDTTETEWLYLQHFVNWNEPKKIGIDKYEGRRKEIWYLIQGLLVKKTDKNKIINYLKKQNFWGKWLPENRDDFSSLINREKFWSPAYLDTYKENSKIWENIRNTNYEVIVSTESANGGIENDKSGANMKYNIPCKYLFEGMNLKYSPEDGNLENAKSECVVINTNPLSVLIRKNDFIQFLDSNGLDIIWTLLGEKFSFDSNDREESYFKVPCGVYYLENSEIKGRIIMYDRN